MKLQSVKKDSQLNLSGIKFDVQWSDGSISQVAATDEAGNIVVFKTESYTFKVLVKEPPKMVKRYLLKGTVAGVPVENFYDQRHEATDAMSTHESMVTRDEYCSLEVSEVECAEQP